MTLAEQIALDLRSRTRELIKNQKITRKRLAADVGVSYSWMYRFVADHEDTRNPTSKTLTKLERRVTELERIR
jgi:transcriptional regulator with XRE-family HTH domain